MSREIGDLAKFKEKIKVGFVVQDGDWLGGRNYLINLIRAIDRLPDSILEPVLLKGNTISDPGGDFPGTTILSTSLLDDRSTQRFCLRAIKAMSGRDWLLERLLVKNGIEVLSHSGHLGRNASVATIGWIPDFQFMHLPEFFTVAECSLRRRWYRTLCGACDRVIVSSETVRNDLRTFYPEHADKADVLRFVSSALCEEQSSTLSTLQQKYETPDRYFLLPNQFWAHKNHRVVIDALKILKDAGHSLAVYATGRTEDHRNPNFFPSLKEHAIRCGVTDNFRILGVVPFGDLVGLMRNAVAFINPSNFEGWSTSVEESKTLGKLVVLSDIPVHREQAPRLGRYCPQDVAETLAKTLLSVWQTYDPSTDIANQERARDEFAARQMEFARSYEKIVRTARRS